jgi:chromosome segregation ATPase
MNDNPHIAQIRETITVLASWSRTDNTQEYVDYGMAALSDLKAELTNLRRQRNTAYEDKAMLHNSYAMAIEDMVKIERERDALRDTLELIKKTAEEGRDLWYFHTAREVLNTTKSTP